MDGRYTIDYNRSVVKDTLMDEEIYYKVSNSGITRIIQVLNRQEKELEDHNKTQILTLALGIVIGFVIGVVML